MDCWFSDRQTLRAPPLPLRRTQRGDVLSLEANVPLPVMPEAVGCRISDNLDIDGVRRAPSGRQACATAVRATAMTHARALRQGAPLK